MSERTRRIDEDAALRAVVEGTASETGVAFYRALVQSMAKALDTRGAWVTRYVPEVDKLRALAFYFGGQSLHDFDTRLSALRVKRPCGIGDSSTSPIA